MEVEPGRGSHVDANRLALQIAGRRNPPIFPRDDEDRPFDFAYRPDDGERFPVDGGDGDRRIGGEGEVDLSRKQVGQPQMADNPGGRLQPRREVAFSWAM
jgi:hypothetical protein